MIAGLFHVGRIAPRTLAKLGEVCDRHIINSEFVNLFHVEQFPAFAEQLLRCGVFHVEHYCIAPTQSALHESRTQLSTALELFHVKHLAP